jgi:hypothetical protein
VREKKNRKIKKKRDDWKKKGIEVARQRESVAAPSAPGACLQLLSAIHTRIYIVAIKNVAPAAPGRSLASCVCVCVRIERAIGQQHARLAICCIKESNKKKKKDKIVNFDGFGVDNFINLIIDHLLISI